MKWPIKWLALKDLLARYTGVWRNVWQVRKELEPVKRSKDERDFLPAHLELTETPVSAAPKWTARLIILFALLALLWSWFGKMDIVVVAQGETAPSGESKVIQPLETAEVKKIAVRDGQHVQLGETLLSLSALGSDADLEQSQTALLAARLSVLRNQALLDALEQERAPHIEPQAARALEISETALASAQTLVVNQYRAWHAQDRQLQSVIRQHQAELEVTRAQVSKLISVGEIERQRTSDLAELAKQHFLSEHAYLEQKSKLIANRNDLQSQRKQLQQIEAAIDQARDSRRVNTQNLRRDTLDALREARERSDQLRAQTAKARQRQELMTLRAPVSGTVQQLAVHTVGGVVTAAQPVMVIVPDEYRIQIDALILNKDIGFIELGQEAVVKIEAFPYTRYGYLNGKVSNISFDAIENETLGRVYAARIALDRDYLVIEGRKVRLSAGMNVSAEIKTGKRRVLDYLLSPLRTKIDASMKQR